MAAAVKLSDIKIESVIPDFSKKCADSLLPGEIPGASVINHILPAGESEVFEGQSGFIRIFFLITGSLCFASDGSETAYAERAVYVTYPQSKVIIEAKADSQFIEIRWEMNDEDLKELAGNDKLPFSQAYADALQYRDFFKSETTISRAILPQTFIPRFAMGTVEAKGDELVGQHAHPLLDQFFFSFPENDMDMLIDCRICPLKGNQIVHIPLGSNHGVIIRGEQRMHYLWLDFTPQDLKNDAIEYLNDVHKPTGMKQTIE